MSGTIQHLPFREVWAVDFEFGANPGELPEPRCMVARELRSGRLVRVFGDDLRTGTPPISLGRDALYVAYFASAEMGCHLALGWPVPENVLDLFVEFRNATNGFPGVGRSLIAALTHYGLPHIGGVEKEEMRQLAIRGGPYTGDEARALLDYCQSDVDALGDLLPVLLPKLDLERALVRGLYMKAVARMEQVGVPVDAEQLTALRENWADIKLKLVERIDTNYGVYEGTTFKLAKFEQWLAKSRIPWPRTEAGNLELADDTFKQMAKAHPALAPLRELRHALSELRLEALAVGRDGRNRTLLSPFHSRTGRNQPSNTKFIFGPSVWLRGLIRPTPGNALAYVDWSQQEFGIAAALAGDQAMMDAYSSGDPYLEFAKQARAVPPDATKKSNGAERDKFKQCALAVQYGMGEKSLALRMGQPEAEGRRLLALHRATYPRYWLWSQGAIDHAFLRGRLWTTFGWQIHATADSKPTSVGNFPMQANGAEMLRLACCFATERGIRVCAPVHDAVLIEAPESSIDEAVHEMQAAMEKASAIVLGGFRLRSDAKVIKAPDRYMDERGTTMWMQVQRLLDEVRQAA